MAALSAGNGFLIKEKNAERAFEVFCELIAHGAPGLCISHIHPVDVKRKYGVKGTVLWLSKVEKEYALSPSNLGIIRDAIIAFVQRNENSAVLLDGIEYLITTNGFDLTLKFLHDVREQIVLNRARLIVPANPEALDSRQIALFERHMNSL